MTCLDVRAWLETPAEERRLRDETAADEHARRCPSCRDAIAVTRSLEHGLRHLPAPAPPAGMAAGIMARIERLADEPAAVSADTAPSRQVTFERASAVPAGLTSLVGLAVVCGAVVYRWYNAGLGFDLMSARPGIETAGWPAPDLAALGLALGALIYVAGLVGPWPERRRGPGVRA